MKENKKLIKDVLKKTLNREDKFENLVLNLALKKMTGAKEDAAGVFYSKKQKVTKNISSTGTTLSMVLPRRNCRL